MTYQRIEPQPSNLLPNEIGVELEDGLQVAVKVTPTRQANSTGVVFDATARCIDANGDDIIDDGAPIHTGMTYSADSPTILALGIPAIARELLYGLLGEPLTPTEETAMLRDEEGNVIPGSEYILTGTLLGLDTASTEGVSIRKAKQVADETGSISAENLLGI